MKKKKKSIIKRIDKTIKNVFEYKKDGKKLKVPKLSKILKKL